MKKPLVDSFTAETQGKIKFSDSKEQKLRSRDRIQRTCDNEGFSRNAESEHSVCSQFSNVSVDMAQTRQRNEKAAKNTSKSMTSLVSAVSQCKRIVESERSSNEIPHSNAVMSSQANRGLLETFKNPGLLLNEGNSERNIAEGDQIQMKRRPLIISSLKKGYLENEKYALEETAD